MSSGFITSIVRTYYTFKVFQSPDESYNIIIMGVWTWAEMTVGTVICCLPVMPRFLQHCRSKINGASSVEPISDLEDGRGLQRLNATKDTLSTMLPEFPSKILRTSDSISAASTNSIEGHAPHLSLDITLDGFEIPMSELGSANSPSTQIALDRPPKAKI